MSTSMTDVLEFIEDNDIKFIRLAFCDIFGVQKNISIVPGELLRAAAEGITFDASTLVGFVNVDHSDLLLFPDLSTMCILPWRPSTGRVMRFFCDIRYPDGTPFEGDGRRMLAEAVRDIQAEGLRCLLGTESEFYLFELDAAGAPTRIPQDYASCLDVSPLDRGENVRRQICLTLEEMGIQPQTSHHEHGPGQNEIDFKYSTPLEAADNFITFKWVVKNMASASGLFASFLPKPLAAQPGSGLHINLSLLRDGQNIFRDPHIAHSAEAEAFIAGVLARAREMTLFFNPLVGSYERLGESGAPRYITWSHHNCAPLIRIPAAHGIHRRMEYRAADGTLNPYLAFTLLIRAGLDGMARSLTLPAACDANLLTADAQLRAGYESLPGSLAEAVELAEQSAFVRSVLPARLLTGLVAAKRQECAQAARHRDAHTAVAGREFEQY